MRGETTRPTPGDELQGWPRPAGDCAQRPARGSRGGGKAAMYNPWQVGASLAPARGGPRPFPTPRARPPDRSGATPLLEFSALGLRTAQGATPRRPGPRPLLKPHGTPSLPPSRCPTGLPDLGTNRICCYSPQGGCPGKNSKRFTGWPGNPFIFAPSAAAL